MAEDVFYGFQKPQSGNSDSTAMAFMFQQLMARVWTSTLVRVEAVTNAGELDAVGYVNILPLVSQINGRGDATPHGIIHNVPYFRIQGGANAMILDPAQGDIGLAIFASRDISAVKTTKGPNTPGSFRRFDPADALYIGGFLNGVPEQYVRFSADGVEIVSPTEVKIVAPLITLDGAVTATGQVTGEAGADFADPVTAPNFVADTVSLKTHTHPVTSAPGNTGAPNP